MRYAAAEKLEIIKIVEQSKLPVRRALAQIGVSRPTFYRWYELYVSGGPEALADRPSRPGRVWNRISDDIRASIIAMALDKPELSPRELAVNFTDTEAYFVSEASVYRLLKAHDLITSPAFIVKKRRMNSIPKPPRRTSSGKPTSHISRSPAGDGSICPPSSTTSRAT